MNTQDVGSIAERGQSDMSRARLDTTQSSDLSCQDAFHGYLITGYEKTVGNRYS